MHIAICIGCGCTDHAACEDPETCQPCHWLDVDYDEGRGVCSACPDELERWEHGDRTVAVPVEACAELLIDEADVPY
ncbi:hypothetical protein [Azohydromonas lata]|uniref:Ferredoxin n=1 Tax=Azohydromonas lata TaxID=45677 RepID=A0ABU5IDB8_9BURK|nr:hypothetical protein [Azohydromonas lata]MDZ5456968.1 hypothetical protein [Azohydromonas lata]